MIYCRQVLSDKKVVLKTSHLANLLLRGFFYGILFFIKQCNEMRIRSGMWSVRTLEISTFFQPLYQDHNGGKLWNSELQPLKESPVKQILN